MISETLDLFQSNVERRVQRPHGQFLKWIGNKQRFAEEIIGNFPRDIGCYHEPFLGSGAVLATLNPNIAVGADIFAPLIDIWKALASSPEQVKEWYRARWEMAAKLGKKEGYDEIRGAFNRLPNGPDLLFLCRSCYGGVVRFRKSDGHMSTPCGIHNPMPPETFCKRVDEWHQRVKSTTFTCQDYRQTMMAASEGDLVYCDPPYSHSQAIIYGAQNFRLEDLFASIASCKSRGVRVALSVDGSKKSGNVLCDLPIPDKLFEKEIFVDCGRSMLKRFQMDGQTMESEVVSDRLLLTF